MDVHSTANSVFKLGVHPTNDEITPVVANRELPSLVFDISQELTVRKRRPSGTKYTTLVTTHKEYMSGDVEGEACYDELPFQLASVVHYRTGDPTGATLAKTFQFRPNPSARDTSRAYTAEWGDVTPGSVDGWRSTGVFLNEWGYELNREQFTVEGAVMGQKPEPISAFSASSMIDYVPILPEHCRVYTAANMADVLDPMGTRTKLTRLFRMTFGIGNRFNPFWPVDGDLSGYGGRVEDIPEVGASFTVAAHKTAGDFSGGNTPFTLARQRAGSLIWICLEATGPIIETTTPYLFRHAMALKISDPYEHTDVDGTVLGVTWPCEVVYDPVAGYPYTMDLVSKLAAL